MSKIYSAGDQKFEAIELLDSVKLMNESEETWEATWETHVEALHSFFGEFNHWSGDHQGVDIEGPFGSLHGNPGQFIVKLKWDIFLVLSAEDFQKDYTLVVKKPRKDVSEENSKDVIAAWYATRVSSAAELAEFARHLNEDYNHAYGTVVHATAAVSLAAGHLLASQQGITGFQAGCANWEWIKRWNCWEIPPRPIGELERELLAFLKQKYVQRADERHAAMGVMYMTAETNDLAYTVARFIEQRTTQAAKDLGLSSKL